MNQGVFIVLEGSDGSGKTTQLKVLEERLKAVGYDVEVFDFPRYEEDSSYFVRQYLNGDYGPASEVNPYTASLFYALDRFEASPKIKKALENGKIVLSNRYVGSSMAHQGSKFTNEGEQRGFFIWEDGLEYNLLGIPRPNLTVYLRISAEISERLIKGRSIKNKQPLDEHEKDLDHLKKAVATFDLLSKLFPKDFKAIECTKNGQVLPVAEINDKIWKHVKPMLPTQPPNKAKPRSLKLESLQKERLKINDSKRSEKNPAKVGEAGAEIKIFNLKNISWLAASIIETSGTLKMEKISNTQGKKAFTIQNLSRELNSKYDDCLSRINDLKEEIDKQLTKKQRLKKHENNLRGSLIEDEIKGALLATTPMARLVDATFEASETKINEITSKLQLYRLSELNFIASQLSFAASKFWHTGTEASEAEVSKDEPELLRKTLSEIAQKLLPPNLSTSTEAVSLIKSTPRNELDLISDELYQYANVGESDVVMELDGITYEEKSAMFLEMISKPDLDITDKITYRFDVISDLFTAQALINNSHIKEPRVQLPTPRYGFDVPGIIEDAAIEEKFNECFDLSLDLFSSFQSEGKQSEAAYSCLLGHKFRWQFSLTATNLISLNKSNLRGESDRLAEMMLERAAGSHPLSIAYLKKHRASQKVGSSSQDRKIARK